MKCTYKVYLDLIFTEGCVNEETMSIFLTLDW